jgi:hypothetical protein
MHLYKVTRTDRADYDEYTSLVVRASSAKQAVELACAPKPYDSMTPELYTGFRLDGSNAKVELLPVAGKAEVVHSSFHSG